MFGFSSFAEIPFATRSNVLIWSLIPDGQTPNWAAINDGQTPNWTAVNDGQTVTWVEVITQ